MPHGKHCTKRGTCLISWTHHSIARKDLLSSPVYKRGLRGGYIHTYVYIYMYMQLAQGHVHAQLLIVSSSLQPHVL